ncbi:MAG: hypothetical protein PVH48_00210, partial [Cyclobacteriaceae bacterium]
NPVIGQGISAIVDHSTNPGEVLMEFDTRSPEIKGSYYLFSDWQKGDFMLNSGASIKDQWLNYDVEYDLIEVKLDKEVKIVPLSMLKQFNTTNNNQETQFFQPCNNYFYDQKVPMVGICEILDSNYYGLISKFETDIKESTYIPTLDMGKKEDELIVIEKLYLTKGNYAIKIPKKKQDFIQLYPRMTDLDSFLKQKKLNHKNKDDLLIILDFLNEEQYFQ